MAYDGWIKFGNIELVNLSRTAQLAQSMGIDTLWTEPSTVQWIQDALAGEDYDLITEAPWYDAGHAASAEFAGIVPLSISGLDDSTLEASTTEYITDGGSSGKPRNKTLTLVASVAVVASTARGADFGKRWLDKVLTGSGARTTCSGSDLRYFQYKQAEGQPVPPQAHRRDVTLSRGTSVTRKRESYCSATWMVTFTWTANDPFEYGDEVSVLASLGAAVPVGTTDYGTLAMTEQDCPVYDYTPIYDPLHPALVPSPVAPDFYPAGWAFVSGEDFTRWWAVLGPAEPSGLDFVPVLTLHAATEYRAVRVSIWPADRAVDTFCEPLWSAIISYLPAGIDFVIDGEQQAAYAWDGVSPVVRRTDSLVYGAGARPIEWDQFNDPSGLLVTLDALTDPAYYGDGSLRASLSLVPKSN